MPTGENAPTTTGEQTTTRSAVTTGGKTTTTRSTRSSTTRTEGQTTNLPTTSTTTKTSTTTTTTAKPTDPPEETGGIPAAVTAAGMTQLVFEDEFDDPATVDWEATGRPGYNWYVDRPFGWPRLNKRDISFKDSVLTIQPEDSYANWSIGSYSPKGNTGAAFRYAYFEARLRFDVTKTQDDIRKEGFPAWWGFSVDHTVGRNNARWGELDFFEAMINGEKGKYTGTYVASVHDWISWQGGNHQNPNNWIDGIVTQGWHTYGCLWTPGEITWYLDGRYVTDVKYAADSPPVPVSNGTNFNGCYSILDEEQMLLVLGTGRDWPLEVDWVRVWQQP